MTGIRISIVTPCLNDREYLPAAMRSVLGQGYPELEYIVIDGGSQDGSVDVIRQSEDRLAFWVSELDSGHYAALNKGFARSSGEVMAWLNSDDMYCPWALRTVAHIFTACPQVEWLTTTTKMIWTTEDEATDPEYSRGYTRRWFFAGEHIRLGRRDRGVIQQESTFWRRSLWERVGSRLEERYSLAGDFELWARFWNHADLYATSVPLGGFRRRPGQRSEDWEQYSDEVRQILALRAVERDASRGRRRLRELPSRALDKAMALLQDSRAHYVRYQPYLGEWQTDRNVLL
ncbi:MAG: glycosyltransferase [Armatimonadetes bacterium]|nr:glycosyltransferase [Armatimonadota bacterium]